MHKENRLPTCHPGTAITGHTSLSSNFKGSAGQMSAVVAVAVATVIIASALSVDAGFLWQMRRKLQAAADAAAVSGAQAEINGDSYTAAAQNSARLNGFAPDDPNVTITVNDPPQSGPYAGQAGYVETVIQEKVPTYFLSVIGLHTIEVAGRAVAAYGPNGTVGVGGGGGGGGGGQVTDGRTCIYALDPSASGALTFDGASLFAADCGILVNSSSSSAVKINDANISWGRFTLGIVGNYSLSPLLGIGFLTSIHPQPMTGIAPVTDPLSKLSAPGFDGSKCDYVNLTSDGVTTLSNNLPVVNTSFPPGVYCGGIHLSGSAVLRLVNSDPSQPYVMLGGGITVNDGAVLVGRRNVTFYLTGNSTYPYAGVNINTANANLLFAPNSGSLAGMLFFQDRNISSATAAANPNTIKGGSASIYHGVLYFPTTALSYAGAEATVALDSSPYTIVIADTVDFLGASATVIDSDYSGLALGSPIKSVAQVE